MGESTGLGGFKLRRINHARCLTNDDSQIEAVAGPSMSNTKTEHGRGEGEGAVRAAC